MSRQYCDYLIDALSSWGKVSAKSMFGGFGLYYREKIFAIVVDDVLYFKVGDSNRRDYESAGSEQFSYEAAGGKKAVMSYWQVPADALEDQETLAEWAENAYQVAMQTAQKPKKKSKK